MNEQLFKQLNEMGKEALQNLIEDAKDYAIYKGIAQRDLKFSKDARTHLPFCLLPCEISKDWFQHVYTCQKSLNYVLHEVSYNRDFLRYCLLSTIETDEFIRKLFQIYEAVFDIGGIEQQVSLGLIRSDFFIQCDKSGNVNGIKQVENNTFAVGLGGVSPLLKDLYEFVFEKLNCKDYGSHLPENKSCVGLAQGLISAYKFYTITNKTSAVILFVVEESTFNILDQRILEYKIAEYNVQVLRCTFKHLRSNLHLTDRKLYVDGKEVAVVYFRVGYAPEHYELEDWTTRFLIEQSKAIKCPSIGLHLAGTKRVQLCLTRRGVLERFTTPFWIKELRGLFIFQCPLDPIHKYDISAAVHNPEKYVLKAEREGGGNNFYGLELSKILLQEHDQELRNTYILMKKIITPEVPNYIIRSDQNHKACSVNCELGIFGIILGNKRQKIINETVGHLLRCKPVESNEGGIASGAGALSYPYFA